MKLVKDTALWALKIALGCGLFALGFDLFLVPHGMNAGGMTGLAMVFVHVTGLGSVGALSALINLPLFALGGLKVGKKFFIGSALGLAFSSALIDAFALLPIPQVEPLVAVLYGSALCGVGLGLVLTVGASTGGSDIIVRVLKLKFQHVPIGVINIVFDCFVVALTALAFRDVTKALYSGITIFVCGQVVDAVVYRFDYSKVALIISAHHAPIAEAIGRELDRGATYLRGEGTYSGRECKVVLTAVRRQQIAELKRIVTQIDPNAFIIVQEAHQILGEGFSRYSKESL